MSSEEVLQMIMKSENLTEIRSLQYEDQILLKENINGKDYFTHRIRFEAFVVIDDEDMPSISKKRAMSSKDFLQMIMKSENLKEIRSLQVDQHRCCKEGIKSKEYYRHHITFNAVVEVEVEGIPSESKTKTSKEVKKRTFEIVKEFGSLQVGDHIAVMKKIMGVKYHHHGILIAPYVVIDFGGDDKSSAAVREVDLLKFIEGRLGFVRFVYPTGKCLPPTKVIKVAKNLAANPDNWKKYSIFKNNCEHFATFCKTGTAFCKQFQTIPLECIKDTANSCSASS